MKGSSFRTNTFEPAGTAYDDLANLKLVIVTVALEPTGDAFDFATTVITPDRTAAAPISAAITRSVERSRPVGCSVRWPRRPATSAATPNAMPMSAPGTTRRAGMKSKKLWNPPRLNAVQKSAMMLATPARIPTAFDHQPNR